MNNVLGCSTGLLQSNYRQLGQQALNHRQQAVQQLLSQRQLPPQGWNDMYIQAMLQEIAMMDSNNFIDTVGVGEREGRVYSAIVRNRHMNLSHGMGRSGDLLAQQPKAAGSSLLLTLTHALTLHAIKLAGLTEAKQVMLLPCATGMSIVLALMAIKQQHPSTLQAQAQSLKYAQSIMSSLSNAENSAAETVPPIPPSPTPLYVIWSRIDQKTCLKSIFAAGLTPIVIELKQEGDALVTDVEAIEKAIQKVGPQNVLAVVTTTSCFAPRLPDKVVEVSKICATHNVAHVINNAYGLQSSSTCALINSAVRKRGRVDAVISSMDKNFLVPVGGAMIIGFQVKEKKKTVPTPAHVASKSQPESKLSAAPAAAATSSSTVSPVTSKPYPVLDLVSSLYPGRASSSSITDLFITLLNMGADGWTKLLKERERLLPVFKARMDLLAAQHGERLLLTEGNDISFGITLNTIEANGLPIGVISASSNAISPPTPSDQDNQSDAGSSVSISSSSLPPTDNMNALSSEVPSKFVPSYLGSLLFSRNVSGPRVLSSHTGSAKINGLTFQHYGTHSNSYPHAYVTAACGIGMREEEVELFAQRLDKCIKEFHRQKSRPVNPSRSKSVSEKI